MTYLNEIFTITAQTNLHAGSGDTSYGIIDNLVQKDSISELPVINASSLKGALRQFIDFQCKGNNFIKNNEWEIFGSPAKEISGAPLHKVGNYNFLTAKLLVLPVRSSQKRFFRAICIEGITSLLEDAEFNKAELPDDLKTVILELKKKTIVKDKPVILENYKGLLLEDFEINDESQIYLNNEHRAVLEKYLGENLVIFHEDNFSELCEDLPVIARNHLENGESKNLWYEQVVPRQSMFYFTIIRPDDKALNSEFDKLLTNSAVQIGANSSIGYGLCKISKFS